MEMAALWALVALAVGVGLVCTYRRRRERREALFGFAVQHGLEYSREDPFAIDESYPFHLFQQGDGRGCENVLSGAWQGLPVREADYWYYEQDSDSKGNRSRTYHRFSIVVAEVACVMMPVSITHENVLTRLAEHLGFGDIEFESEEFNRAFRVRAADPEFAYKLVDARMMSWLLGMGGGFSFEVAGPYLLVYCGRRGPTDLVPLFGGAKLFTDRIPRIVWTEYGAAEGAAAPSVPPGSDPTERRSP